MSSSGSGDSQTPIVYYEGEDEYYADKIPPGFRFFPTDEELVEKFLANKINGNDFNWMRQITEVDLYSYHPDRLIEEYKDKGKEGFWYFFTSRKSRYLKGTRAARNAGGLGFWRAVLAEIPIKKQREGATDIGMMMTLSYIEGKQIERENQKKTSWLMHEYRIVKPDKTGELEKPTFDDYVLCKLYQSRNATSNESDRPMKKQKSSNKTSSTASKKRKSSNITPSTDLIEPQPQQSTLIQSHNPVPLLQSRTQPPNFASFSQQQQVQVISPQIRNFCPCTQCTNQYLLQLSADPLPNPAPDSNFAEADNGYYNDLVTISQQDFDTQYQNFTPNFANYVTELIQSVPNSYNMSESQFHLQFGTAPIQPASTSYNIRENQLHFQSRQFPSRNVINDASVSRGNPPAERMPRGFQNS